MSTGSGNRANPAQREYCDCGFPVASLVSWTENNPGRRFERCKFYSGNPHDGLGCRYWRWVDEGNVRWQRDLCNHLLAENKALKKEVSNLKEKLDSMEVDNVFWAKQASESKVKLGFTNGPKLGGAKFMFYLLVAVILGGVIVRILG
ncbi:hypothetical protein RDABS01_018832 [Bienertia sinuspersici]